MHKSDEFAAALLAFPSLEAALAPPTVFAPGLIDCSLAAVRAWRERRHARLTLSEVDARLLRDIGLTREGRRVDYLAP